MEFFDFILKFLVLVTLVTGIIIFVLYRTHISNTEGAIQRLQVEIQKTNQKQAELSAKLKDADDELNKRRAEAKELAEKMRSDAQEESKAEREKIIAKAREEGEEIIAKAQGATEKMKLEMENEIHMKAVDFGVDIISDVMSEKTKGDLDIVLIEDFLDKLKSTDMSRIAGDVSSADLVTLNSIADDIKGKFTAVIKEKLNRDITINNVTDNTIAGGAILRFGSMALDGSLKNAFKEKAILMQEEIEKS